MPRQKRGVDIDYAESGKVDDRWSEDLAVGCDQDQVGLQFAKPDIASFWRRRSGW